MKKQWVIPDIHGCVNTLKALIEEQIKPTRYDELYFLGDYIDRGPNSKAVIDYIRNLQKDEYSVKPLKGNHEDFVVELYDAEHKSKNPWFFHFANRKKKSWSAIGGRHTLKSFRVKSVKDIPHDYIEWMRNLDYYVILENFVLVHAGLNFSVDDPFEDKRSMLWLRDYKIIPEMINNRKIIHGHVPVNLQLIDLSIKSNIYKFIDLDNGPYISGTNGFGYLVALELSEMRMVIQDNRDL
ncbi:MAG: metallophosphoesterase [Bacteroidetes bacterium]|nr:metallophosphoesterase [Bacteroidota bacterium]